MALTESAMIELGTAAPEFVLPDVVSRRQVSLSALSGKKALVLMFICRHCPFVRHVQEELARIGKDYARESVAIVAISSNDPVAYPNDAPERLREQAEELGFRFPYCFDESQAVARAYGATCTPDFYVFDAGRRLVYRGQLDDSRPGNGIPVTGRDLRAAIDAVLSGRAVSNQQKPSIGCNIKWRSE
jgi:peroxiredoxin